ncbi:DUF2062 domain-containing protein [Pleurocapsales cyanobacterium LEGE 06147]|nr:DUF2062 domain-containing protein [Pleurocapsales cyanobacterium LEGE 06147]
MREFYSKGNSRLSNFFSSRKNICYRQTKRNQFWWQRWYRLYYLRLLRWQGKPEFIARGLALGVFSGCFPFFGLQIIIGVILATLLRGNKVAAAAATWISNPFTYVPLFIFNYQVGKFILGIEIELDKQLDLDSFSSFMELGFSFAATLVFGCFMVGLIVSLLTYFVSLHFFKRFRQKRKRYIDYRL